MPDKKKLSVIVPCYNEKNTILIIIDKILKAKPINKEIIIVDDFSNDGTIDVLKNLESIENIKILFHKKNYGKGKAIRTALQEISGEIIIIQDADLEYDPEEIPALIEPIVKGLADVVYGSRFRIRKTGRVMYFYHYLANVMLTFISNLFTNLNMTDIETCYKAFKSPILQNITITSKGFGIEIELTAKIAKLKGVRVFEVPISYYGRSYEEGKKILISDGMWALWYIFKYNCFCSIKKSFSLPHQEILKQF